MNPLAIVEAVRLGILTWAQIQQMRASGLFTEEEWQRIDQRYQERIPQAEAQAQPGATPDGSTGSGSFIDA